MILRNDYIGATAYNKIASIMQIKTGNTFWNYQEDNIKKNILNGFKTLYKHNWQVNNQTKNIIQTKLNTLNILKQYKDLKVIDTSLTKKVEQRINMVFHKKKLSS